VESSKIRQAEILKRGQAAGFRLAAVDAFLFLPAFLFQRWILNLT
jgi:hypothetical protein